VFNYIVACILMLFLRANDPFLFGTVARAMFNTLRLETFDGWDQVRKSTRNASAILP
jgi:hypothetical protein